MKRFERLLGAYKEWSEGLIVGATVTQAILWLYLYIYPMPWLLPVGIVAGLVTSYVGKYRKTKALITAAVLVFVAYVLYASWVANANNGLATAGPSPNEWMWTPTMLGVFVLIVAFLLAMIYLFKTHTTIDNTLKPLRLSGRLPEPLGYFRTCSFNDLQRDKHLLHSHRHGALDWRQPRRYPNTAPAQHWV